MPAYTLRADGSDGLVVSSAVVVKAGDVAGEVRTWAELAAVATDPASAGKTFHVRAGDYGSRTLTGAVPVRLVGRPGEESRVVFGALTLSDCRGLVVDGFRATVEVNQRRNVDCIVRRARIGTVQADGYGTAGTSSSLNGCTRCGFELCDMTGDQVLETAYALNRDCWAHGCSFHHPRTDCCWTWWCDGMTWEDCEFHHIVEHGPHNDGIQMAADTSVQGARVGRVTVRGCLFRDCTSQCFFARGGAFPDVVFENNLSVRCGGGFQLWAFFGCDGLTIRDNTCWDGGNADLSLRQDTGGPPNKRVVLERNVCHTWNLPDPNLTANLVSRRHNIGGTGLTVGGYADKILSAPAFVDSARDDWRLARPVTFPDGQTVTPGVDWQPADKQFGPGW